MSEDDQIYRTLEDDNIEYEAMQYFEPFFNMIPVPEVPKDQSVQVVPEVQVSAVQVVPEVQQA